MRESWNDFDIEDMAASLRKATKTIVRTTREHPYAALAIAAGLGFVIAGGLRSRTGRALMGIGTRAVLPQLQAAAMAVVRGREADATAGD